MALKELQVITDLGTGIVQVRIEAENHTATRRNISCTVEVRAAGGTEPLIEPFAADLDLPPDGSATEEIMTAVYFPNAWSPEEPTLYEVRTIVEEDAGDTADVTRVVTGFREFACDADGSYRLNGRRVPIRPARVGAGEEPGVLTANAKREGYNMLRIHAADAGAGFFDACDRTGLMACVILDAAGDVGSAVKAFRNHPSVVLWDVYAGRGPASRADGETLAAIRAVDPTRMVILRKGPEDERLPEVALQCNPYVAGWQRNWDPEDPQGDKFDLERIFETFNP